MGADAEARVSVEAPPPPEIPPAASSGSASGGNPPGAVGAMDRSVVHGVLWTTGAKWAGQALRWGSTFIVARLLTPADYGLVAMGGVLIGLVQFVSELGLSSAIVRDRSLDEDQIAHLGGLSVLLGVAFFALCAAIAEPVAQFYRQPALVPIVIALSSTFLLRGFQVLPRALMMRELSFRRLAAIDVMEGAVLGGATLVAALLGAGYWSLVIGNLAAALASAVAFRVSRGHRLRFFGPIARVRGALALGWHIVVTRIAWYVYTSADTVVIGRVLGSSVLGAYSFGATLATIPVDRVASVLNRVAYATFAEVQTDVAAMRRYFVSFAEAIAFLTMPAAIGLALVADLFVPVALGPQWDGAVWPLRVLCLATPLRALVPLVSQLLVTAGHARRNRDQNVIAAVTMSALFVVGSRWGVLGVASAWVIGYPIVVLPNVRLALSHLGLRLRDLPVVFWSSISTTLAMAAAVLAARTLTPDTLHGVARLGIAVAAGALGALAAVWTLHRGRVAPLVALVRRPTPRTAPASPDADDLDDPTLA